MRAAEALERLLMMATELMGIHPSQRPVEAEQKEAEEVATAICTAMLNTAIPIARWRLHVEIEEVERKSKFSVTDFTICATHTASLQSALVGFWLADAKVSISLWEQKVNGAEMVMGYQGHTKDQKFRRFFDQLKYWQVEPTVQ